MCVQRSLRGRGFAVVLTVVGSFVSSVACAGLVQFDVVPLVEYHEVTPAEFAALNPDEKLIEARFQVSAMVTSASPDLLDQYMLRIESVSGPVWVMDFAPKTSVAATVAGNFAVENSHEQGRGGKLALAGDVPGVGKLDSALQHDDRHSAHVRYELLPPHELVVASGTTRNGRGVYFKLRPSQQGTLEGARELQVILRVPRAWRGDRFLVYCTAWSSAAVARTSAELAGPGGSGHADAGRSVDGEQFAFGVVLYEAGDLPGKQAARGLLEADRQLRAAAWSWARKRAAKPSPWKVAWQQVRGETRDTLPDYWLQWTTVDPAATATAPFFGQLPATVQSAVREYLAAVERLQNPRLLPESSSASGLAAGL